MSDTPYHLRQLGVPEDAGPDRAVPRAIHAYQKTRGDKKEVLSLYYSMVMAKALPQFNAKPSWTRSDVTHEKLAGMNGVRRETITWRLIRCSDGRRRWNDDERRRKYSRRMKQRATIAGKKIHSKALRSLDAVNGKIFCVTPRFNHTNLHTGGPDGVNHSKLTKTAELLAQRFGEETFDPKARVNGFKKIYAWLWHPALPDPVDCECQSQGSLFQNPAECPKCHGAGWRLREPSKLEQERGLTYGALPDYARLAASYYLMQGIEEEIPEMRSSNGEILRRRKPAGMLQITQSDRAAALGMDEDTLRKHDQKLARLTIVKIVPGEKEYYPGTRKVRRSDPDKLIWMPSQLLDHEVCVAEMERFIAERNKLNAREHTWAAAASNIHLALLKQWEGKEHSLKAFWNELRRRLARHGVPHSVREALLPVYRE